MNRIEGEVGNLERMAHALVENDTVSAEAIYRGMAAGYMAQVLDLARVFKEMADNKKDTDVSEKSQMVIDFMENKIDADIEFIKSVLKNKGML